MEGLRITSKWQKIMTMDFYASAFSTFKDVDAWSSRWIPISQDPALVNSQAFIFVTSGRLWHFGKYFNLLFSCERDGRIKPASTSERRLWGVHLLLIQVSARKLMRVFTETSDVTFEFDPIKCKEQTSSYTLVLKEKKVALKGDVILVKKRKLMDYLNKRNQKYSLFLRKCFS